MTGSSPDACSSACRRVTNALVIVAVMIDSNDNPPSISTAPMALPSASPGTTSP